MFSKLYGNSVSKIDIAAGKFPAAIVLGGLVAGILPVILNPGGAVYAMLYVTAPLLLLSVPLLRRKSAVFICAALAGGILTAAFSGRIASSSYAASLPDSPCGGMIEAVVSDSSCGGADNRWLRNPPLLKARVLRIKSAGSGWRETNGKIALRLPRDFKPVNYGDIIHASGAFLIPPGNVPEQTFRWNHGNPEPAASGNMSGFNLKEYLRTEGTYRIFQARTAIVAGRLNSLYAKVLDGRNRLMAATVAGIGRQDEQGLMAALVFGCKQGLGWQSRNAFISSGTIHVFTVSGLHVGMLALLLFWILRSVPFSTRHIVVPVLIFFYVLTTGMHPPAVRALIMIALWSFCRALLLSTPALNIVFFSAALLIIINPLYLLDTGFQFSFIVVSFLIASTRTINRWLSLIGEKANWIPPGMRRQTDIYGGRTVRLALSSLAGCLVAWLASSGITLYYQGIYVPSAILANLLIMPVVWLLFAAVFVKLLLHPLSWLTIFTGGFFRFLLGTITVIGGFFHDYFENLPAVRPSPLTLLIFYLALILMITAQRKKIFFPAAAAVLAVSLYWHSAAFFQSPEIAVIHGGDSNEPAIVICLPAQQSATVINVPSWEAAGAIANYLKFKGISRIRRLAVCGGTKDFCAGSQRLLSIFSADQVIITGSPRGKYFREAAAAALNAGSNVITMDESGSPGQTEFKFSRPDFKLDIKNQHTAIEYSVQSLNIKFDMFNDQFGVREIRITGRGGSRTMRLENKNVMEITNLVFDE